MMQPRCDDGMVSQPAQAIHSCSRQPLSSRSPMQGVRGSFCRIVRLGDSQCRRDSVKPLSMIANCARGCPAALTSCGPTQVGRSRASAAVPKPSSSWTTAGMPMRASIGRPETTSLIIRGSIIGSTVFWTPFPLPLNGLECAYRTILQKLPRNPMQGPAWASRGSEDDESVVSSILLLPKILEPSAGELGVPRCVLNVAMPEPLLQGPGVVGIVGELEPARVPKHVRVDRKPGFPD